MQKPVFEQQLTAHAKRKADSQRRMVSSRPPITQMDRCILCNNVKYHADDCSMVEIQKRIQNETAEKLIAEIPTTWLDNLLTGPDAVMKGNGGTWGCPDIEKLLNAIRARLKAANDGLQRPGSPDGSLATETRKPSSLK